MNRRDIIIIAVLINAGLLVVLFTSALKSDKNEPVMAAQTEMTSPPTTHVQMPTPLVRGDEVDQVLSQFAAASTQESSVATPMLQPVAMNSDPASSTSFLEEVQGFKEAAALSSPAPAHTEVAAPSYKEVKVKKGDALEKIARANHTTVQEIMRANKLSSTQLKIGQILKIPAKGAKPRASAKADAGDLHYYTVKNGDSPWTIAVKNQMKVEELLELNGLNEEKARKLKPGDQLRIR